MKIEAATTDAEILAAYPVLRQLRPKLVEADFVGAVRHGLEELGSYLSIDVADVSHG